MTTSPSREAAAIISFQQDAWSIVFHPYHNQPDTATSSSSGSSSSNNNYSSSHLEGVLLTSISLADLYGGNDSEAYRAFSYDDSTTASAATSEATTTTTTTKHVSTIHNKSSSKNVMAKAARVALADYTMRTLSKLLNTDNNNGNGHNNNITSLLTMEQAKHHNQNFFDSSTKSRRMQARKRNNLLSSMRKKEEVPYVLERTDCYVADDNNDDAGGAVLQFFLHVGSHNNISSSSSSSNQVPLNTTTVQQCLSNTLQGVLSKLITRLSSEECFSHIASVVLQRQLRAMLQPPKNATARNSDNNNNNSSSSSNDDDDNDNNVTKREKLDETSSQAAAGDPSHPIQTNEYHLNAVAFIADGSLLPRKSGRSVQPMKSPPAIPFSSPQESEQLTKVVEVYVGTFWRGFLKKDDHDANSPSSSSSSSSSTVTLRGMIIPRGVTLIVGGGYHGKSTILQALSYGVYDKVPGDGRELCVTHSDAVSIRAEDGRYVNNVNVSAFINSIPSGKTINGASISSSKSDTTKFSTMDASGSTSQAANVIEALECQASALLVDEDVSAANFMARDGRMRAMIMDEPITPLLYRVNGLYLSKEHNTSTVVVVGGVGEWLDVADAVVLMKNYVAYDGLKKARSVSYQFSYGHVQYAGRGVVHRLPWEVKEEKMLREENEDCDDMDVDAKKMTTLSPLRRRPLSDCIVSKFRDAAVHMPEGSSSRLWLYSDSSESLNDMEDYDEDDGIIDMSKCSQLVGNASEQLYGCGICILWLMQEAQRHMDDDIFDLLDRLEDVLEYGGGMNAIFASLVSSTNNEASTTGSTKEMLSMLLSSHTTLDLYDTVGFCYHPRRHEVAMALTRMRGMKFEILPEKPKEVDSETSEEEAKRLEEEAKKKALADLWANRRKRGVNR